MNSFQIVAKAFTDTVVTTASLVSKSLGGCEDLVDLATKEVAMLSEAQKARMDTIRFERDELLDGYSDKRKEWQSKSSSK